MDIPTKWILQKTDDTSQDVMTPPRCLRPVDVGTKNSSKSAALATPHFNSATNAGTWRSPVGVPPRIPDRQRLQRPPELSTPTRRTEKASSYASEHPSRPSSEKPAVSSASVGPKYGNGCILPRLFPSNTLLSSAAGAGSWRTLHAQPPRLPTAAQASCLRALSTRHPRSSNSIKAHCVNTGSDLISP